MIDRQWKTQELARELGVQPGTIVAAVRAGRLGKIQKDCSGHYAWCEADVKKARALFATRLHELRRSAAERAGEEL